MKRIYLFSALMCLVAVTVVFSCKKKAEEPVYDVSHLNEKFDVLRTAAQKMTVQAGRDTVVMGADSTVLHFYTNSFKDANGNIITSGSVAIELVEMYGPGAMIANGTSATANGKVLRSGGQVNIKATMNGKEVFANKYGLFFKQPGPSEQPMSLYYGNASTDEIVVWTEGINNYVGTTRVSTEWDTATQQLIKKYTTTTVMTPWFIRFDSCVHFDWINCDIEHQWGVPATDLTIALPGNSFNDTNTRVFLVYPEINSSINIRAQTHTVFKNPIKDHPLGKQYKLAVIANVNGTYYYYEKSGTITENETITPALAPDSYGDIKTRLRGL